MTVGADLYTWTNTFPSPGGPDEHLDDRTGLPARGPAQPGSTDARSHVRLTRRGRVVVFVFSLFLAFAIGILIAAGSVATEEPGTPEPTRVMTVGTGDTLWGIATELAGDGDIREMMRRIERLNALESGMLFAGQRLVVPAGDRGGRAATVSDQVT